MDCRRAGGAHSITALTATLRPVQSRTWGRADHGHADEPQDMAPAEDVWLVDHALIFAEVSDAVAAMRAYPDLLQRIAGILEVACQDEAHSAATESAAAAADSTPCEVAAAEDGAMARHSDNTADDAAAAKAEAQEGRAGDDALMQQVVGRLHEVVYEVVFQESAGGQPSSRKHRQAHPGEVSYGLSPAWAVRAVHA